METINIINDFEQNILMENILIMNQEKLLEMIFDIFYDDFNDKTSEELTIEYVKAYFSKLKYINWELFVRLMNMTNKIYKNIQGIHGNIQRIYSNSFEYIISLCKLNSHLKILDFLLKIPKNIINWDNMIGKDIYIGYEIISYPLFYSNEDIISNFLKLSLHDINFWYEAIDYNYDYKIPINCLFQFSSENLLLELIKDNKFDLTKPFILNDKDTCSFTSENIFPIIIENVKYNSSTPLEILIKRNFVKILEYLSENKYKINDRYELKIKIIDSACKSNNIKIIKILTNSQFNIDFNFSSYYGYDSILKIKSEEIMIYLIKNNNLILSDKIFYHAILNNWETIINYYIDTESIDWDKLNYPWVIINLSFRNKFYYSLYVLANGLANFRSNLHKEMDKYYLDPYGFENENNENDEDENEENNEDENKE